MVPLALAVRGVLGKITTIVRASTMVAMTAIPLLKRPEAGLGAGCAGVVDFPFGGCCVPVDGC